MQENQHADFFNEAVLEELYGVLLHAVIWMKPIYDNDSSITDFKFAYCNKKGMEYLQIQTKHNNLCLSNSPGLNDELRQKVFDEVMKVFTTGNAIQTTLFNPALSKYVRVIRIRLGEGVLTMIEDRTEETETIKKLQEKTNELEKQKSLVDSILTNSSNGISVSKIFRDNNGNVIDALTIIANDAAVNYIGLPKDIYLSKKATELEPAVMTSSYYKACVNALETGVPFVMQYKMESTGRWLELSVSKLDYNHLIQIFTDVTEIKEAQLKVEQSLEVLRKSNENLEEFAYAASHDLQEPLRKIQTFCRMLRQELEAKLNDKQIQVFERIDKALSRMKMLILDLLRFSELNTMPASLSMINLNQVLDSVLQDFESSIAETNAVVLKDNFPHILGDERQLRQLFHNLIGNALKYRKPNESPIISIKCAATVTGKFVSPAAEVSKDDYYIIEVSDNGIGFEEQYREKIFKVFQRLHSKAEYEGTGVGLSIVKKVVDNHNGFISVESKIGEGTIFQVLLPKTSAINN